MTTTTDDIHAAMDHDRRMKTLASMIAEITEEYTKSLRRTTELREQLDSCCSAMRVMERAVDGDPDVNEMIRKMALSIYILPISPRAKNCLLSGQIMVVGDLVRLSRNDILQLRSAGKTTLREIERELKNLGLSLGMDISNDIVIAAKAIATPIA